MTEKDLIKKALSDNLTDKNAIYSNIVMSATKPNKRSYPMKKLIIAAAVITLLSITAFASVRLLSPQEVAEDMVFTTESGETIDHFATPFESGDMVEINESQIDAGLKITFLGFAHGEGIDVSELAVDTSKTYAVIAIENEDGTPIQAIESMPIVSPLVNGMNPGLHNAFTFGAFGMGTLIDGVQYQLMELDVIEYFAGEKLYLCVSDSVPNISSYAFDEHSGEISVNSDYDGLNVLFNLPIDPAKADSARVNEYLAKFENSADDNASDESTADLSYDEIYENLIEQGLNEEDAKHQAQIEISTQNILSMQVSEIIALGTLTFEKTLTADANGEFGVYWSEEAIFTNISKDYFETFEIGVPFIESLSANNSTTKVIILEKVSQTELKSATYTFNNSDLG